MSNYNKFEVRPLQKRSGAKFTRYVNRDGVEKFLTTGWRYSSKVGLILYKAVTTSSSVESDKGWFGSIAVTVTVRDTGFKQFYWGTMNKSTGKVVISDLQFVMNPNANNGGYVGTYINKNKNKNNNSRKNYVMI